MREAPNERPHDRNTWITPVTGLPPIDDARDVLDPYPVATGLVTAVLGILAVIGGLLP